MDTASGRAARNRPQGFTLVETVLAVSLMGLLTLGAVNLYATTCVETLKAAAQTDAATKSANMMQCVMGAMREASAVALPTEAGFTPNAAFTTSNCTTTFGGQTINTAVLITYPGAGSLSVYYGGRVAPITPAPYDRTMPAQPTLLIYRADADGTPDSAAGQYLFQTTGTPQEATRIGTLSDTASVAAATGNAAQFVRTGANQVEVRLMVNNYSLINGQQGSEDTQTPLTAKCVLLRNHG